MNKLISLSEMIIKENKMSAIDIMKHFAKALSHCECGEMETEYQCLYEEAFGKKINREIAEEWVRSMDIPDDIEAKDGQRWTMDNTAEYGNKVNLDWSYVSKIDFYIVMNMMFSDYYKTAKSMEIEDDPMFFARLAKDWLYDADASENKLYKYYFEVVCG